MTSERRPRVYVSGTRRPGDPFVFKAEDDDRIWSPEEKRALRLARRDEAAADAVDRLTHHRKEED
jgi:hypothetical protein